MSEFTLPAPGAKTLPLKNVEIDRINSRKRAADQCEYIESKISKEAAKIIGLKVKQEADNLQLSDEIKSLVCKTEEQEEALLRTATEYTELKMEYQNEIRLREDTVNMAINTRSICNTLENHFGHLASTLTRCQKESKYLCDTYKVVVDIITKEKEKFKNSEESYQSQISNLQENLNRTIHSNNQMAEAWTLSKKTMEENIELLKSMNASTNEELTNLKEAYSAINNNADILKAELSEKYKTVNDLSNELKLLKETYSTDINTAKLLVAQYEKEISTAKAALEKEKLAVANQDTFMEKLTHDKNFVCEKLAELEELQKDAQTKMSELEEQNSTLTSTCHALHQENNILRQDYEKMDAEIASKKEILTTMSIEKAMITEQLSKNTTDYEAKETKWNHLKDELEKKTAQLLESNANLTKRVVDQGKSIECYKNEKEEMQKSIIALKDHVEERITEAVRVKTMVVLSEMKTISDVRFQLEIRVDQLVKDNEYLKTKYEEVNQQYKSTEDKADNLQRKLMEITQKEHKSIQENLTLVSQNRKLHKLNNQANLEFTSLKKDLENKKNQVLLLENQLNEMESRSQRFVFEKPISLKSPSPNTNIKIFNKVPSPPPSQSISTPRSALLKTQSTQIKNLDDYWLMSDSSLDSVVIEQAEVDRRYEEIEKAGKLRQNNVPKNKIRPGKVSRQSNSKGRPFAEVNTPAKSFAQIKSKPSRKY